MKATRTIQVEMTVEEAASLLADMLSDAVPLGVNVNSSLDGIVIELDSDSGNPNFWGALDELGVPY